MSALEVRDLTVRFGHGRHAVTAVDGVSLEVPGQAVLGVVGESGSGKSTLARAIVGLQRPTSGAINLDGVDLTSRRRFNALDRARRVQMIFQDPYSCLNPRMTVGQAISEALLAREGMTAAARKGEMQSLLDLVRLQSSVVDNYPRHLSGGMRQRVVIARCLAVQPRFIVADEITSALDASVQAAVLNLVRDLRAELGLSMLFITHNVAVARFMSDEILVMDKGRVVEQGPSDRVIHSPEHPYTQALIGAIPRIEHAGTGALSSPSSQAIAVASMSDET